MNPDEAQTEEGVVQPEYARMYYEHQYQRFAQLEQHGFTVSNLVIGICLLALGWTSTTEVSFVDDKRQVLLLMVAALNAVAIVYLIRVFYAKRSHQKRAKAVLHHYAKSLLQIDGGFPQPTPISPFKRSFIQMGFHLIIIVASVALI